MYKHIYCSIEQNFEGGYITMPEWPFKVTTKVVCGPCNNFCYYFLRHFHPHLECGRRFEELEELEERKELKKKKSIDE